MRRTIRTQISKLLHLHCKITALFLAFPSLVLADADTALTFGSGPNDYRSYAFKANVDLFDLPVQLNLDQFLAKSTGSSDMKQSGLGLTWDVTDLLSAEYRYSTTNDGTFDVIGNEGELTFNLDEIWQGDLQTALNIGYGTFDFTPTAIARPKLANKLSFTQDRNSIGLSQDITSSFSIFALHSQYTYDRNVKSTALAILHPILNSSKAAFTLLSFPDQTSTWGIGWKPMEKLGLDLSTGRTSTLLQQRQKNTRLGMDYQFTDTLNIAAAVTRASATAVVNANGKIAQQASNDTYTEFTLGWSF